MSKHLYCPICYPVVKRILTKLYYWKNTCPSEFYSQNTGIPAVIAFFRYFILKFQLRNPKM